MQTSKQLIAEMDADPTIVRGIRAAAKFADVTVQRLDDEMSCFHLPFIEVDGEYIFLRASLERLAA